MSSNVKSDLIKGLKAEMNRKIGNLEHKITQLEERVARLAEIVSEKAADPQSNPPSKFSRKPL